MNKPVYYTNGKYDRPLTFAVKHNDLDTRMESRSGGIFTALSDYVLKDGGVVYGCVLDDDFRAVHMRAESAPDRDRMRGSKYVQSDMRDTLKSVKKDLDDGRSVLFTGTSCQVAGLNGYLGKPYPNLLTVDIVCHGVPSPSVWKDYLGWQESRNNSKVVNADFRNKKDYGWKADIETLYFENGTRFDGRVFSALFYSHLILRPSCYHCPYKSTVHPADITIADYWGIDKAAPGFNDDKGVSLVLINDDVGKIAFEAVRDSVEVRDTKIEDSMQPALRESYKAPDNRQSFWKDYRKLSFDRIARKYGEFGKAAMIKRKIRWIIKKK